MLRFRMTRPRSRPIVIAERQISLSGRIVSYTVKRSLGARRVRIEIKDGTGLTVTIPRHCKLESVEDMLVAKSGWVLRNIDRYDRPGEHAARKQLTFGDTVPYLGEEMTIVSSQEAGLDGPVDLCGHDLVVHQCLDGVNLEPLLEQWYRTQAASVLEQKAADSAAAVSVKYNRLSIRGQRTRWGSCSHRGTLSFNWRLVMAPMPVVDYVVIHEVAHLKEMNHTKRFWTLVAESCPSWREHKKWLDDHGTELASVLRPAR
jgi:predicted metal-dependent hydrolase